jgi:hypothetical protein
MNVEHPDFHALAKICNSIESRAGGREKLKAALPGILQEAIDFVLDSVRTARTKIAELDNVEKTFIGLKIEHFIRDFLDLPKGVRDLNIDGVDVDIKNTVQKTWMIPPETYRTGDACLLIAVATDRGCCSLGLMLAKSEYLSSPNRDAKRAVSSFGRQNIYWLVQNEPLPPSTWNNLDMERFRELRRIGPGALRAAQFFRENVGRRIHRKVVRALLFDQEDYMKRLRENGGARDLLRPDNIALISGAYGAEAVRELGLPPLAGDEWLAVMPANSEDADALRRHGLLS